MSPRSYDAILLDLDGTLVDEQERIHPHTLSSLRRVAAQGVVVMIATGRSDLATIPVLAALGINEPAVVFNGAAVWCPERGELIEERVLSDRTLERAVDYGISRGLLTVTMGAGEKFAVRPRREVERLALREMTGLSHVEPEGLLGRRTTRVTIFSDGHPDSRVFGEEVETHVGAPIYLTHFPLSVLPMHRESRLLVADVHPPCRGKAEGLRLLEERHGIPAERVIAFGDASNDVPMFEAAGLAVAMAGSMAEAVSAADRNIGPPDSAAIGELVDELFGR